MKCVIAIGLLVTLLGVYCDEEPAPAEEVIRPQPVGVIYLIQLVNQAAIPKSEEDDLNNVIPNSNPYKSSKLLYALTPNNFDQEKVASREKRSPGGYGKGGGGYCQVCGGGGGGYPGGGGGYGPGGGGYGGGGGGSWATSSSKASAGSFGAGGGKYYG